VELNGRVYRSGADCGWTPKTLAAGALLWAWSGEETLTERFRTMRRIAICLVDGQQQLAETYQAFTKILRRWTDQLVAALQVALHQRMAETLPQYWQVGGVLLFGVDGSRIELPRTVLMSRLTLPCVTGEAVASVARRGG
jgi:hypothetical protein